MKAILTLGVAIVGLAVAVWVLVDEIGVRAAAGVAGCAVASVVAGVAVMLVEWGGRGKAD